MLPYDTDEEVLAAYRQALERGERDRAAAIRFLSPLALTPRLNDVHATYARDEGERSLRAEEEAC